MKKIKRAISLMLVMSMVVSLFAMTGYTASAAEPIKPNTEREYYTDLSDQGGYYSDADNTIPAVKEISGDEAAQYASTSNILTVTPPTTLYVDDNKLIQKTINKNTFANTPDGNQTEYAPSVWATTDLNTSVKLNFTEKVDSATLTAVAIDANGNEETLNNIKVGGTAGSTSGTNLSGEISVEVAGTAMKNNGDSLTTLAYRIDYTIGGKTYTTYAASYVTALPSYKVTSLQILNNKASDSKHHPSSLAVHMDFSSFLWENGFNVEANTIGLNGYTVTNGLYSVSKGVISYHSTTADYSGSDTTDELGYWVPDSATSNMKRSHLPTLYQSNPDKYTEALYVTFSTTDKGYNQNTFINGTNTPVDVTQGITVYYDTAASKDITVDIPVDVIDTDSEGCSEHAEYEHGAAKLEKLSKYNTDNDKFTVADLHEKKTITEVDGEVTFGGIVRDGNNGNFYPSDWANPLNGEASNKEEDKDNQRIGTVKTQAASITFNKSVFGAFTENNETGEKIDPSSSYRMSLYTRAFYKKHRHSNNNNYRTSMSWGYHFNFKAIDLTNAHAVIDNTVAYATNEWSNWSNYRKTITEAYSKIGNLSATSEDVASDAAAVPGGYTGKAYLTNKVNLGCIIDWNQETSFATCSACGAAGAEYYTAASWSAYTSALAEAKAIRESAAEVCLDKAQAEAVQAEINAKGSALADAMTNLTVEDHLANTEAFDTAKQKADEKYGDGTNSKYTTSTWNTFVSAYNTYASKDWSNACVKNQTEINEAASSLSVATQGLVQRGDSSQLSARITFAQAVVADGTLTAASKSALESAIADANAVLAAADEKTQAQLDEALTALNNALAAVVTEETNPGSAATGTPAISAPKDGAASAERLEKVANDHKELANGSFASAEKAKVSFVESNKSATETLGRDAYIYTNDKDNTMFVVEASAELANPVTLTVRARSKHGSANAYVADLNADKTATSNKKISITGAATEVTQTVAFKANAYTKDTKAYIVLNPTFKDNTNAAEKKRSFVEYEIVAKGANGKQETYNVIFAYYNDDAEGNTGLGVEKIDEGKWTSNGFGIKRIHDDTLNWWEIIGSDARAYDNDFGTAEHGSFALEVSGYTTAAEVTAAIKNGSQTTAGAIVYGGNQTNNTEHPEWPIHDEYYFKDQSAASGKTYYVHLVDRFGNTCSELVTLDKVDSVEPSVQSNGSRVTITDMGGSMLESLELTSNGEAYDGWAISDKNVSDNTLNISNLAPNSTYSLTATDAAGNASTVDLKANSKGNAKITLNNYADLLYVDSNDANVDRKTGEDKSVATVLLNGEAVTINNNVKTSFWQKLVQALSDLIFTLFGTFSFTQA